MTPRDFLVALFPAWPAGVFAEVRAFRDGQISRDWVGSATGIIAVANQLKRTYDVYVGAGARRGHDGTKAGVAYVSALWADLDMPLSEARRRLDRFELPPSAIVSSGHGAHPYWFLKEPYEIEGDGDREYVEARLRGLAKALGADACWDISRVLRVPSTINHKNGERLPVELVDFEPGRRYNVCDFDLYAIEGPPMQDVEFTGDADAEAAMAKAETNGLPARTWRLITEGHAEDADRSRGDFGAICDLIRAGLSDDEIRAIFQHCPIGAKYQEEGDRYLARTVASARGEVAKGEPDEPDGKDAQARREALRRAKETVASWLLLDDDRVVDVVLAVPVANAAPGDPVWVIIVAASSSAKTELIRGLNRCPQVFALSTLTDRTFASGFGDPHQSSLLPRLAEGQTLTFKDFGSILSMRPDAKSEVLGQLREIYDGSYRKPFGTGRELVWEGRLGFLTASTPAIERHHGVIGELGERFLWFRIETPSEDRSEIVDVALKDSGQEAQMREEIAQAFVDVIGGICADEVAAVSCSAEMKKLIGAAANLATWLRTPVARDYRDKNISYQPLPEGPARMAKALLRLGKALAAVRGQDEIDEAVAELLVKLALDSVPPNRVSAVRFLARQEGWTRSRTVALNAHIPTSTATLLLEDVNVLGVIDKRVEGQDADEDESGRNAYEWRLKPAIKNLLATVQPGVPEGSE